MAKRSAKKRALRAKPAKRPARAARRRAPAKKSVGFEFSYQKLLIAIVVGIVGGGITANPVVGAVLGVGAFALLSIYSPR